MKINELAWAVAHKIDKKTQYDGTTKVVTVAKFSMAETRTSENIKGDFEKWENLCDRKADCRRLGVLI